MRLIDGDEFELAIVGAISLLDKAIKSFDMEEDEYLQGERKAYEDMLEGIRLMPTIEV